VNVLAPLMMPAQPYRIAHIQAETAAGDVVTWRLEAQTQALAPPLPGQFNLIQYQGMPAVPLCISDEADSDVLFHTLRASGPTTRALHDLKVGDVVQVRGPYGSAWPLAATQDQDLLLIAGGLGLSSLRPLVNRLMREPTLCRQAFFLYGTRTPMDILYRGDVIAWERRPHLHAQVTVDLGGPAWRGNVGVVTKLIEQASFDPARAIAFVCGPEAMMRYAILALQKRGVSPAQIHVSLERTMPAASRGGEGAVLPCTRFMQKSA